MRRLSVFVLLAFVLLGTADAVAAPRAAPWSVIRSAMHRTYELGPYGDPRFGSSSRRAVVSDGRGGSLTAVTGLRMPTADAKGQLVFFFHNRRFLGWDANRTSIAIYGPHAAGTRRFSIRYVHYARKDPLCCPSLRPVTIRYRWNGRRITASRRPPNLGVRVRLRPVAHAARRGRRGCGTVRVGGSRFRVTIQRGRVRCPTARRVLRRFLSGGGVRHGHGPQANIYYTLEGWRCGTGAGGGGCIRAGKDFRRARDYITAIS